MASEDLMDKVFSFFSGEGLTDEKQNMLKAIAKELNQSKYVKFFRVRTEEADPSFSSFLFSVYKVIYPFKDFYRDETKLAKLRAMIINSCLDDGINETLKRLDHDKLDEKAGSMPPAALVSAIEGDVEILIHQFSMEKIAAVNHRHDLVLALGQLVKYDFKGFFKKFDPHFADGSFIIEPRFPSIKTILIVDQIGEFLSVTQPIKPEDDWTGLLKLFNTCEGIDLATADQFNAMVKMLREIHTSKILELMVQYTLRNPVWAYKHSVYHKTIGEDWLEGKKKEAQKYIAKINTAQKNRQIKALTDQIFETTELIRLENYTPLYSEAYSKKNVDHFLYAEGVNYLKTFLDEYVEKEIKELCDILLIRGQWTDNQMSREMSDSLHRLMETFTPIADLDIVLSEDGSDGSRLRAAMLRVDRDSTQMRYINSIVGKVNSEAHEIINEAAQALIVIGKHLKNLIDDVGKKHPDLLINWREINLASKEPIAQRMVADFKKINYFVQLMHLCTQ